MYRERLVELSSWNPGGDLGTIRTLGIMKRYARRALPDPLLQGAARRILGGAAAPAAMAAAVRSWLARVFQFQPDPPGVELVKTPRRQLLELERTGRVTGDCDDAAVLGAALGRAVGLPARFVAVGFERGMPFRHVWTELETPDGWVELDVTRPDQPWVDELEIARRMTRTV